MSKKHLTNGHREISPNAFLKSFGLRPNGVKLDSSSFRKAVEAAGGDYTVITDSSDRFCASLNDQLFRTEVIARCILSNDCHRLAGHLRDFNTVEGFPAQPRCIADLGGGSGLLGMWLAQQHPQSKVTVYDHSPNALAVGRKWAGDRSISNLSFVEASYECLAEAPPRPVCDLVLLYHAVELDIEPPSSSGGFLYGDSCEGGTVTPRPSILTAAAAMSNLLAPDGVGVITGAWSEWGLIELFEALHRSSLGIDWRVTFCEGTVKAGKVLVTRNYIFVRKSLPRIAESSWEECRAYMTCGDYSGNGPELSNAVLESYSAIFAAGKLLLNAEARHCSGGAERFRLLQHSGLLLCEHTSSIGFRFGQIYSLAAVFQVRDQILETVRQWKEAGQVETPTVTSHPALQLPAPGQPAANA